MTPENFTQLAIAWTDAVVAVGWHVLEKVSPLAAVLVYRVLSIKLMAHEAALSRLSVLHGQNAAAIERLQPSDVTEKSDKIEPLAIRMHVNSQPVTAAPDLSGVIPPGGAR